MLLLFAGCGSSPESESDESPVQPSAASDEHNDAANTDSEPDPLTQEVRAAIEEMIAAIESGGIRALIESYTAEEELERLRARGPKAFEFQVKMLERPELTQMITEFLIAVRQSTPTFDDSRVEATLQMQFANDVPDEPPVVLPADLNAKKQAMVKGFGDDLDVVLRKAVEALEETESIWEVRGFAENIFPIGELQHPETWQFSSRLASLTDRIDRSPKLLEQMILDLKQMQKIAPRYEQDGRLAVFTLYGSTDASVPRTPDRQIRMELIDGNWRFFDNTKPALEEISKWSKRPLSDPGELSSHMPFVRLRKTDSGWKLAVLPRIFH